MLATATPASPPPAFSFALPLVCVAALLVPHDFGSVYSVGKSIVLLIGLLWLTPRRRIGLSMDHSLLLGATLWLWPLVSALWHSGRLGFHTRDSFSFLTAWCAIGAALLLQVTLTKSTRAALRSGITFSAVVTALWLLLAALWQGTTLSSPEVWGAAGPWGNRNVAAHFLVLALALGGQPRRRPWFEIVLAAALLASGSRAACAAGLLWLLCQPWWRRDPRRLLGALLLLCGGLSLFLWRDSDARRFATYLIAPDRYVAARLTQPAVIDERAVVFRGKSDSALSRLILWRHSLQLVAHKPWLGYGPGQFRVAYPGRVRAPDPNLSDTFRPFHAHQGLLEAATLFGVPWLLLALLALTKFTTQRDAPPWRQALFLQLLLAMVSINYTNSFIIVLLLVCAPPAGQPDPTPSSASRPFRAAATIFLVAIALAARPGLQQFAARQTGLAPTWLALAQARSAADQGRYQEAWHSICRELYADPYGPTPRHNLATLWEHWAQRDPTIDPEPAAALYRDNARRFPFYRASHSDAVRLSGRDLDKNPGEQPSPDDAAWERWLSSHPAPDPRRNPWLPSP